MQNGLSNKETKSFECGLLHKVIFIYNYTHYIRVYAKS